MPNDYITRYLFKYFFLLFQYLIPLCCCQFFLENKNMFAYTDLPKSMGQSFAVGHDPDCVALLCICFWIPVNKWWDAGSLEV